MYEYNNVHPILLYADDTDLLTIQSNKSQLRLNSHYNNRYCSRSSVLYNNIVLYKAMPYLYTILYADDTDLLTIQSSKSRLHPRSPYNSRYYSRSSV